MTPSDCVALRRPQPFGDGWLRNEERRGPHNWMQRDHAQRQFWMNCAIYLSALEDTASTLNSPARGLRLGVGAS